MQLSNRLKKMEDTATARRDSILKPFFAAIGIETGQRWIDIFADYHTRGVEPVGPDLEFMTNLDTILGLYYNAAK